MQRIIYKNQYIIYKAMGGFHLQLQHVTLCIKLERLGRCMVSCG